MMSPILQGCILVLLAGLAFGIAEWRRQDLSIECVNRDARPDCRVRLREGFSASDLALPAGELVAAVHERREHRDSDNDLYYTDHLVLSRRDGTVWASDHQDDARLMAARLRAYLNDPAAATFSAAASNRAYYRAIAAIFLIGVFAVMNIQRSRVFMAAVGMILAVLVAYYGFG